MCVIAGGPLLEFEVGSGRVIKGFDDAVRGLSVGDSRKVRCEPKDAYGDYDDENVAIVVRHSSFLSAFVCPSAILPSFRFCNSVFRVLLSKLLSLHEPLRFPIACHLISANPTS